MNCSYYLSYNNVNIIITVYTYIRMRGLHLFVIMPVSCLSRKQMI